MSLVLNGTDGLSDVDGSAATPAIRGTDVNTGIFFPAADTIAFAEGGAEVMRIDSSGNVGIGTSSPYAPNGKNLNLNDAGGTIARFTLSVSGAKSYSVNSTSDSALTVYDNTAGAERARIDSSGRLLVDCTTEPFSVAGIGLSPGGAGYFTRSSAASIWASRLTTTGDLIALGYAGVQRGSISTNGSSISYNTSSDYRLKNTIAPMTGALAKVALLNPVTYKWNFDNSDGQGFIAHELAEVCPDAVQGAKDAVDAEGNPQYQGIDTSFLVATLTAAIQEQQAIITALTARVEALEGTQP